jgi:hypothetical protein
MSSRNIYAHGYAKIKSAAKRHKNQSEKRENRKKEKILLSRQDTFSRGMKYVAGVNYRACVNRAKRKALGAKCNRQYAIAPALPRIATTELLLRF